MKIGDTVQFKHTGHAKFEVKVILDGRVYVKCLNTGGSYSYRENQLEVVEPIETKKTEELINIQEEQLAEFFGMDNAEEIAGYLSANMRLLERGDISIKEFIAMHIPETDNTKWEEEK